MRAAVLIEWVGGLEPLLHNPAGLPGSKISALSLLVNILVSHVHAFTRAAYKSDLHEKIRLLLRKYAGIEYTNFVNK